jgi:hypothetical protein
MKLATLFAVLVVFSSAIYAPESWVLYYRVGGSTQHKNFQSRDEATDWIEHDQPTYLAIELRHADAVYPCHTHYDMESSGIPGILEKHKIVGCWSKAEMDDFKHRQGPSPAAGWTVN